ncbi:peptide chain release factor N(5)-glutamine methyltransferase [Proteinivorax tanatarense]|uniref:Release factor glutamine methyltransferase n=1 Tax=Proteinivorax tanatarense TaxID=1260629 RepID=A0AAU7VL89_9FIRM
MKEITIKEALVRASALLKESSIENPFFESQLLLKHVLECRLTDLIAKDNNFLTKDQLLQFKAMIDKRAKHYPVAYIIGYKEFMGIKFKVTKDVLIPRPDTEVLIEWALSKLELTNGIKTVVDVGAGSGAIGLTIAKLCADVRVHATEISEKSLKIAQNNAVDIGVKNKVTFYNGSLLEPIINREIKADMILSNLPYIPEDEYESLGKTVKEYEPKSALVGGETGLEIYSQLLSQVGKVLRSEGVIAFEIGYNQQKASLELLKEWGFKNSEVLYDLGGHPRVVVGQKK